MISLRLIILSEISPIHSVGYLKIEGEIREFILEKKIKQ